MKELQLGCHPFLSFPRLFKMSLIECHNSSTSNPKVLLQTNSGPIHLSFISQASELHGKKTKKNRKESIFDGGLAKLVQVHQFCTHCVSGFNKVLKTRWGNVMLACAEVKKRHHHHQNTCNIAEGACALSKE